MQMTVFWDVEPCSLVQVYRRFRGACCLHHQGDEAASTPEMAVNFYRTTWRNIPGDSHLDKKHHSGQQVKILFQILKRDSKGKFLNLPKSLAITTGCVTTERDIVPTIL
jgi:hypothetical protein